MKKFLLIGLMIAAMVVPGALFAQVEVANGTIQIGGKLKWNYTYMAEDTDADGRGGSAAFPARSVAGQRYGMNGIPVESFNTQNAEIDITGTVGENVSYVIQLQASFQSGGLVGGAAPNEFGGVGIRQAGIIVTDVIPMTTVVLGTGFLPVSIYSQRETHDFDMIMLPLINAMPGGPGGAAPNAVGIATGVGGGITRQTTGVLFAIAPMDMLEIDLGYYNGLHNGGANAESDLEKSWLIKLKVTPTEAALIEISYIKEGWQANWAGTNANTEQQNAVAWVISGAYITDKLEINADWVQGTVEDAQVKFGKNNPVDLSATGYQITAGYWITDAIEGLIRYEFVDPNTANSNRVIGSKYDQLTWWTLGVNCRLNESSEVAINYVMRGEEGSDIDDSGSSLVAKVPSNTGIWGTSKYQVLDNDLFLIQVQVWQ